MKWLLGRHDRWQEDLFVAGPLSSLIPDDHILKQVDKLLDLSWLRSEVKDLYFRLRAALISRMAIRSAGS